MESLTECSMTWEWIISELVNSPEWRKLWNLLRISLTWFSCWKHFDESLLLLKESLGLSFRDISYAKKSNQGKEHEKLGKKSARKLTSILAPDILLYNHFKAIFASKLTKLFGKQRLKQELERFRKTRREIECISNNRTTSDKSFCKLYTMTDYYDDCRITNILKRVQSERLEVLK